MRIWKESFFSFRDEKSLTFYNISLWFEMLVSSDSMFTPSKGWVLCKYASAVMAFFSEITLLICWSKLEEKSAMTTLVKLSEK